MFSDRFRPGPWHLGKFGLVINSWAILWTAFISIVFLCPTERPVTALNMNYAIAFLGAIFLAMLVYWFISGRKWYTGPLSEAEILETNSETDIQRAMEDKDHMEKNLDSMP
jgi:hypothetical protein